MRRMMLWWIAGPRGRRGTLIGLRYRTADGRIVALPVQAAHDADGRFDVAVADAAHKSWWRHFRRAAPLEVLTGGTWHAATAVVTREGEDADARTRYAARFPGIRLGPGARLVRITPSPPSEDHGGVQS